MNKVLKKKTVYLFMLLFSILAMSGVYIGMSAVWGGAPEFSVPSGFYENSFNLSLRAGKNTRIYYTLDGSEPDENGMLYEGPILIEDATGQANRDSMRRDTSTGFYTDLIADRNCLDGQPGYMVPDFPVEKCTVIRAVAVTPLGIKSKTVDSTYFVGIRPEDYGGCNILSLITDPDNLFDAAQGIYVTGEKFEEYCASHQTEEMEAYWHLWNANYLQHGKEWERPVSVRIFNPQGKVMLEKDCGVRAHGSYSRGALPRGLNLYARPEYDGAETFAYAFWEDDYLPQSLTLTSGGNHTITQFKDYAVADRAGDLSVSTLRNSPYVLFINGEYWGFYWLAEKYDAKYLEFHYDVDPSEIVMIKNNACELGGRSGSALYSDMIGFISDNDMTLPENYERACELIDIQSFADYYALMIYLGRKGDWPFDNYALWRTTGSQTGPYSDGRWRWLVFDCNSTSMSSDLISDNTLQITLEADAMFASLWANEDFRQLFQARIMAVAEDCFDKEAMKTYIDAYKKEIEPILDKSWRRFYGKDNTIRERFTASMDDHLQFFQNRRDTVLEWFQ